MQEILIFKEFASLAEKIHKFAFHTKDSFLI